VDWEFLRENSRSLESEVLHDLEAPVPEQAVTLRQRDLVVKDMDATGTSYRRIGPAIPDPPAWSPGSDVRHAAVAMPDGAYFEPTRSTHRRSDQPLIDRCYSIV
jgi:hypothetical protein